MPPRRAAVALLGALAVAGCGDDAPVRLPDKPPAPKTTAYTGRTSQGERMSIDAGAKAVARVKFRLRCKDGSETDAQLTTRPKSPVVESDGSFYYSETGRADFAGYGDGRYRTAVAGRLQGPKGAGTASFRISFQSTACRGNARWAVKTT